MKGFSPPISQHASSRIAVCTWILNADSPHQLLQQIQQLQISSVQIAISQIINQPHDWDDAVDILRRGGIWVASGKMDLATAGESRIYPPKRAGILSDRTWYATRFHAEKAARLADRASIGLITTQIGEMPLDVAGPEWAKLLDRVGAIAEIFAHYGIDLALETGKGTAVQLDQLIGQLNLQNLGINFDPAAVVLGGLGDPIESLRRLAPRIRQANVRDALPSQSPGGVGREVKVGQGITDWDAFFEVAMGILPPIQFVIVREPRLARDEEIAAARDLIAYHVAPRQELRR